MSATTDKVPVVCPKCNKRLLVPSGTLGKQGRCPACQTVFTLEQLWEAESVPVAPAASPFGGSTGFAPATNQWGQPVAAAPSPFSDDDFQGDYQLQAAPPAPAHSAYSPPQFSPVSTGTYSGSYAPKKERGWDSSVLGGVFLMFISVVVFFGALALGWLIPYMIILFIIGLFTFIKGLFSGNLAGD